MKIKIYWDNKDTKKLIDIVQNSLDELWLVDFIKIEETNDENLKKELDFSKQPALIIEEETIDFKDVIFEWMVPAEDEIKSMLVSIIGWDAGDSCAPTDCWTCWSASVCWI
jgi:hypothetical protein